MKITHPLSTLVLTGYRFQNIPTHPPSCLKPEDWSPRGVTPSFLQPKPTCGTSLGRARAVAMRFLRSTIFSHSLAYLAPLSAHKDTMISISSTVLINGRWGRSSVRNKFNFMLRNAILFIQGYLNNILTKNDLPNNKIVNMRFVAHWSLKMHICRKSTHFQEPPLSFKLQKTNVILALH